MYVGRHADTELSFEFTILFAQRPSSDICIVYELGENGELT